MGRNSLAAMSGQEMFESLLESDSSPPSQEASDSEPDLCASSMLAYQRARAAAAAEAEAAAQEGSDAASQEGSKTAAAAQDIMDQMLAEVEKSQKHWWQQVAETKVEEGQLGNAEKTTVEERQLGNEAKTTALSETELGRIWRKLWRPHRERLHDDVVMPLYEKVQAGKLKMEDWWDTFEEYEEIEEVKYRRWSAKVRKGALRVEDELGVEPMEKKQRVNVEEISSTEIEATETEEETDEMKREGPRERDGEEGSMDWQFLQAKEKATAAAAAAAAAAKFESREVAVFWEAPAGPSSKRRRHIQMHSAWRWQRKKTPHQQQQHQQQQPVIRK